MKKQAYLNGKLIDGEFRKSLLIAGIVAGILAQSPSLSQVANRNPRATTSAQSKAKTKTAPRAKLNSLPVAKPTSKITMDYRDAPIDQILNFYSIVSGLTVIKDPSLTGSATLISPKPITLTQAFNILEALLDSRGYSLDRSNGMMRITPKGRNGFGNAGGPGGFGNAGGPGGFGSAGGPGGFGRSADQTQVFQLQYASAKSVAQIVNDLFKNNGASSGNSGNQGRGFPGFPGGNNQNNNATTTTAAQPTGRAASFARASSDDYSNSVVVTGPADQLTQVATMIDQIDQPVGSNQITQIFPLSYTDATEMATVVSNVLLASSNGGAQSGKSSSIPFEQRAMMSARMGSTAATSGQVVASAETNSLIVTASEDQLNLVQKIIDQMDKPKKMQSTTYIRSLSNASASDVATLLTSMFGNKTNTNSSSNRTNSSSSRTSSSSSFGSSSSSLGSSSNRSGGSIRTGQSYLQPSASSVNQSDLSSQSYEAASVAGPHALSTDSASDPNVNLDNGTVDGQTQLAQFGGFPGGGGFNFGSGSNRSSSSSSTSSTLKSSRTGSGAFTNIIDPTGNVQIVPDVNTNSVIINADPATMAALDQVLKSLDQIPAQVLIEAVIVEANLDKDNKLGFQFSWLNNVGSTGGSGAVAATPTSTYSPTGLKYTITGNNFSAIMQALSTDTRFKILSTPRVFTANNQEAEINVSNQIPYLTSSVVSSTGSTTSSYNFMDVGVILDVTPRITGNGLVTIDVNQQASDFQGYTSFNAPQVSQRTTTTTVVVKDGQTVVIGGLIRESDTKTVNKVPVLGDLPLLGSLFRSKDREKTRTELMVFLTPHVVRTTQDAVDLTEQQRNQLEEKDKVILSKPKETPKPSVGTNGGAEETPQTTNPSAPEKSGSDQTPKAGDEKSPGAGGQTPGSAPQTPDAGGGATPSV